jgi:hypothetical protein
MNTYVLAGLIVLPVFSFCYADNTRDDKTLQKSYQSLSKQPGAVSFLPPEGWHLADPKSLPSNVKLMVVGKGSHTFPPSINLAYDEFNGSLKDYLKVVDTINKRLGADAKNLGPIQTLAGEAQLLQIDSKNSWGIERQMQVILVKEGVAYILTASALKEEFTKFYPQFFQALKSLKINSLEMDGLDEQDSLD